MSDSSEGEPSGEWVENDPNQLRTFAPGELDKILARHAGWLSVKLGTPLSERRGDLDPQEWAEEARSKPQRADLRRADLRMQDLRGANLCEADLSEANLSEADLRGANLTRANLSEADLNVARLIKANLSGANLARAILVFANIKEAKLIKADLSGANLSTADLTRADLSEAKLIKADISEAKLIEADISEGNLIGANLSEANLSEANLSRADLSEGNLSGADLSGADLRGADLSGADLRGANVALVRWDRSRMRGKYRGIRGIDSCYGNALFKRDAADQDYLDTLEASWRDRGWRRVLFRVWGRIEYGRSLLRIAILAFSLMLVFGCIYSTWPHLFGHQDQFYSYPTWCEPRLKLVEDVKRGPVDCFTPFYFSIVTYTTLGFGDLTPKGNGWGEVIVSFEVILGYCTLSLLLSVLAEKVARRS